MNAQESRQRYVILVLVVSLLTFLFLASTAITSQASIEVDIQNASIGPIAGDTFRLLDVFGNGEGYNGQYWADFKWDPVNLVFVPVNVGEQTVTIPSNDIKGSYELVGFFVAYSTGQVISGNEVTVTGSMQIGNEVMSQSFNVNGQQISGTGTYSFLPLKPMGGVFYLNDAIGRHNATVWTYGYTLTTYSGIVRLDSTTTYEEWDYWGKTNNTPASIQSSSHSEESGLGPIGGLVGSQMMR